MPTERDREPRSPMPARTDRPSMTIMPKRAGTRSPSNPGTCERAGRKACSRTGGRARDRRAEGQHHGEQRHRGKKPAGGVSPRRLSRGAPRSAAAAPRARAPASRLKPVILITGDVGRGATSRTAARRPHPPRRRARARASSGEWPPLAPASPPDVPMQSPGARRRGPETASPRAGHARTSDPHKRMCTSAVIAEHVGAELDRLVERPRVETRADAAARTAQEGQRGRGHDRRRRGKARDHARLAPQPPPRQLPGEIHDATGLKKSR